jgi:hypothetical protein
VGEEGAVLCRSTLHAQAPQEWEGNRRPLARSCTRVMSRECSHCRRMGSSGRRFRLLSRLYVTLSLPTIAVPCTTCVARVFLNLPVFDQASRTRSSIVPFIDRVRLTTPHARSFAAQHISVRAGPPFDAVRDSENARIVRK